MSVLVPRGCLNTGLHLQSAPLRVAACTRRCHSVKNATAVHQSMHWLSLHAVALSLTFSLSQRHALLQVRPPFLRKPTPPGWRCFLRRLPSKSDQII